MTPLQEFLKNKKKAMINLLVEFCMFSFLAGILMYMFVYDGDFGLLGVFMGAQ